MDRRKFIKLTAVTGTAATLASCGNPEHEIIRFVPDEDLVPGVATWKPSACPLCRAGCGTIVRVMEGDADVVRNGRRASCGGAWRRSSKATRRIRSTRARCACADRPRFRCRITRTGSHSRFSGQARAARARCSRSPGMRPSPRSSRNSMRSPTAARQASLAYWTRPGRERPARSHRHVPRTVRRGPVGVLRVVRRSGPATRESPELWPRAIADDRHRARAVCAVVRRGLSRHVELPRRAERGLRTRCDRDGRASGASSCRSSRGCR